MPFESKVTISREFQRRLEQLAGLACTRTALIRVLTFGGLPPLRIRILHRHARRREWPRAAAFRPVEEAVRGEPERELRLVAIGLRVSRDVRRRTAGELCPALLVAVPSFPGGT